MSDKRHKYKLHVRCFGESFLLVVQATDSCAALLEQILRYYQQFYHRAGAAFPYTARNVVLRAIVKKPTDQPLFSDVMDLSYLIEDVFENNDEVDVCARMDTTASDSKKRKRDVTESADEPAKKKAKNAGTDVAAMQLETTPSTPVATKTQLNVKKADKNNLGSPTTSDSTPRKETALATKSEAKKKKKKKKGAEDKDQEGAKGVSNTQDDKTQAKADTPRTESVAAAESALAPQSESGKKKKRQSDKKEAALNKSETKETKETKTKDAPKSDTKTTPQKDTKTKDAPKSDTKTTPKKDTKAKETNTKDASKSDAMQDNKDQANTTKDGTAGKDEAKKGADSKKEESKTKDSTTNGTKNKTKDDKDSKAKGDAKKDDSKPKDDKTKDNKNDTKTKDAPKSDNKTKDAPKSDNKTKDPSKSKADSKSTPKQDALPKHADKSSKADKSDAAKQNGKGHVTPVKKVKSDSSSESDSEDSNVFGALGHALAASPVKPRVKQAASKLIITSKRSFSSSDSDDEDAPPQSTGQVVRSVPSAENGAARDPSDIVANVSKDPKQLAKILSDPSKWNL